MKVIYSSDFTSPYRAQPASLVNLGTTAEIISTSSVTAFSIFDTNISSLTVQASNDNFSSFLFSQTLTSISSPTLVELGTSITAQKWRIRANSAGTVGQLYVGRLINITNPGFPLPFESSFFADDRESEGGIIYSRQKYQGRSGTWTWEWIRANEVTDWRLWYTATKGFRNPFVISDPLTDTPYLVKAPGEFPLQLVFNDAFGGQMTLKEVL